MEEIKVEHRKLGREKAWGLSCEDLNTIELDPRLKGKKHLEVCLHEWIHLMNPDWSETRVIKASKIGVKYLWDLKYRRIDDAEKQPKE